MMCFENDILISYAHLDNLSLSPEQEGWISRFHVTLEALLSTRLGQRVKIWRDLKLGDGDVFDQEILDQIHKSVLLVSGCGKSSLVNCGLRPALRRGLMAPAGTVWRVAQFRPGSDPLRRMADALAKEGVLFRNYEARGVSLRDRSFIHPDRAFLMPPGGERLEVGTVIDISHESLGKA